MYCDRLGWQVDVPPSVWALGISAGNDLSVSERVGSADPAPPLVGNALHCSATRGTGPSIVAPTALLRRCEPLVRNDGTATAQVEADAYSALWALIGGMKKMVERAKHCFDDVLDSTFVHGLLLSTKYVIADFPWPHKRQDAATCVVSALLDVMESICTLSLEAMGRTVVHGGGGGIAVHPVERNVPMPEDFREEIALGPKEQVLIVSSWLSIKEVALLIGTMAATVPVGTESILGKAEASRCWDLLHGVMMGTLHNGAIEKSRFGIEGLVAALLRSDSEMRRLPSVWLKSLLARVEDPNIPVVRRSSQLSFSILALLGAEPREFPRVLMPLTMERLLKNARERSISDHAAVHALNVVRHILMDSNLAVPASAYLPEAMEAAFLGFESNNWAVRNSATMVFSVVVSRALGGGTQRKAFSVAEFISRFPSGVPVLRRTLLGAVDRMSEGSNSISPSLCPALVLLAQLDPRPADPRARAPELLSLVRQVASHHMLHVRRMAARALPALVPLGDVSNLIEDLYAASVAAFSGLTSQNRGHGAVLQAQAVIVVHLQSEATVTDIPWERVWGAWMKAALAIVEMKDKKHWSPVTVTNVVDTGIKLLQSQAARDAATRSGSEVNDCMQKLVSVCMDRFSSDYELAGVPLLLETASMLSSVHDCAKSLVSAVKPGHRLDFAWQYVDSVRRQEKLQTIRKQSQSILAFSEGELVVATTLGCEFATLRIEGVSRLRYESLTDEIAQMDGFSNVDELKRALDTHYSALEDKTELLCLRFSVVSAVMKDTIEMMSHSCPDVRRGAVRGLEWWSNFPQLGKCGVCAASELLACVGNEQDEAVTESALRVLDSLLPFPLFVGAQEARERESMLTSLLHSSNPVSAELSLRILSSLVSQIVVSLPQSNWDAERANVAHSLLLKWFDCLEDFASVSNHTDRRLAAVRAFSSEGVVRVLSESPDCACVLQSGKRWTSFAAEMAVQLWTLGISLLQDDMEDVRNTAAEALCPIVGHSDGLHLQPSRTIEVVFDFVTQRFSAVEAWVEWLEGNLDLALKWRGASAGDDLSSAQRLFEVESENFQAEDMLLMQLSAYHLRQLSSRGSPRRRSLGDACKGLKECCDVNSASYSFWIDGASSRSEVFSSIFCCMLDVYSCGTDSVDADSKKLLELAVATLQSNRCHQLLIAAGADLAACVERNAVEAGSPLFFLVSKFS